MWQVITQAPFSFVAVIILIWLFVRHHYAKRFQTMKHTLEMKIDELNTVTSLKDRYR